MSILSFDPNAEPATVSLATVLPGPDRRRSAKSYSFRLLYRNPDPLAVGCMMTWEVHGGRLAYQLAVEREETGELRLHCTCADAIFRAEPEGRVCKHVSGFLKLGRALHEQAQMLRLDLRPAS
jgi:hypothetical protein